MIRLKPALSSATNFTASNERLWVSAIPRQAWPKYHSKTTFCRNYSTLLELQIEKMDILKWKNPNIFKPLKPHIAKKKTKFTQAIVNHQSITQLQQKEYNKFVLIKQNRTPNTFFPSLLFIITNKFTFIPQGKTQPQN